MSCWLCRVGRCVIRYSVTVLIEPASDNRLTGGYIYNSEICRHSHVIDRQLTFARSDAIEFLQRIGSETEKGPTAVGKGIGREVVVVDSLFLDSDDILDTLGSIRGSLRLGLIHYLPFEEPGISKTLRDARLNRFMRASSVLEGFIVTSSYAARILKRIDPTGSRISIVLPGIQEAIHRKIRRRSWPPRTILTVGAVTQMKGHRLALEALRPLRRFVWRWSIVGDSPDASIGSLRRRIERLSFADRVDFVGIVPQSEIGDWYARSDLFLFPTLQESYGMVCAEATANGLPVIAYRTGDVAQIIRHGENGWLTPTGSIGGLRKHLDRAFRSKAMFEKISRGSSVAAVNFRTWDDAAKDFDRTVKSYEILN